MLHSFVCFSHPQQLFTSHGKELLNQSKPSRSDGNLITKLNEKDIDFLYPFQSKIDEAITHLNYALACNSKNQEALIHRANASFFERDYAQAAFYYRAFLSVHPYHIRAQFNLSKSLNELGYFDESQQILETLAGYNPTITIVKKKIVLHYLRNQQWDKAAQIYSVDHWWWYNRNMKNKCILISHDGGYGDVIQFMRYVKRLHNAGAYTVVKTPKVLIQLLSLCPFIDEIVPLGNTPPATDEQYTISTPRLALIMRDTLAKPSEDVPYMHAHKKLVTYWKKYLSTDTNFKIGLCWQSSTMKDLLGNIINGPRGIPLNNFAPLCTIPNVNLYSLQKITGTDQLQNNKDNFTIHDFGPNFDVTHGSFMDTAAVMQHMDLIITVDTSIAHLAGALGVPVWIIVPTASDFRWFKNRDDSPWYPTMRVFRQTMLGTWNDVVTKIINALKQKIQP